MSRQIYNPSRRDFLKGVAIGTGGYAFGSMLIHPKEAMAQSIEGYLEKVPVGDRWNVAAGGAISWSISFHKELYDTKGREQYIEYAKKNWPLIAARSKGFVDRYGFAGNDAKSAAGIISAMVMIGYGPKQKFEIGEATTEKARVKCINCEYWNAMQVRKITDDLCSVLSQCYWGNLAKAINPKLTATLVKARPLGDSVCEWAFELKA